MNCEDCDYSIISDWEQDMKTGKATAIYWCERHKDYCESIQECPYKGVIRNENNI